MAVFSGSRCRGTSRVFFVRNVPSTFVKSWSRANTNSYSVAHETGSHSKVGTSRNTVPLRGDVRTAGSRESGPLRLGPRVNTTGSGTALSTVRASSDHRL